MIEYSMKTFSIRIDCQFVWNEEEQSVLVKTNEGRFLRLKNNTLSVFQMLLSAHVYDIDRDEYCTVFENVAELIRLGVVSENVHCSEVHWNKEMLLISDVHNDHYAYLLFTRQHQKISSLIRQQIIENTYSFASIQEVELLLMKNILTYASMRQYAINQQKDSNFYSYYIALTYCCNLTCTYCFEKKIETSLNLTENSSGKLLTNIRQAIGSHGASDIIDFVFYGGEPLLSRNYFDIKLLVTEYANDQRIKFRVITNGTLIDEFISGCPEAFNFINEFVITLDGPKPVHDLRRKTKTMNGTYSLIIRNIVTLIEHGKTVTVRMNIDSGNFAAAPSFIANLYSSFNRKINISLFPVTENSENSQRDFENEIFLYRVYQELDASVRQEVRFNSLFIDYLRKLQNPRALFITPTLDCNLLTKILVAPDGQFLYCNEGMDQLVFKTEVIKPERHLPFINTSQQCMEKCEFFLLCYGGCPLKRLMFSQSSIDQCIKRSFFSETLKRHFSQLHL